MRARRLYDPARFLKLAGPLLATDEARHNLLFGLSGTLRDDPAAYDEWNLWIVEDDAVVAAALQTPPFNVVVARAAHDRALAVLVEAIHRDGVELPGVTGAVPEADRFAATWAEVAGVEARVRMEQRIYALRSVRPVADVAGAARVASEADLEPLRAWVEAFAAETATATATPPDRLDEVILGRLRRADAGFLFWEDGGEPVSLAGWGGPTPNGTRIGPVYTPPELRRRGYASALVAELSERQLASGRRFCFLYTDAANPTSNRIYTAIGYQHVCDSRELEFSAR